MNWQNVEPNRIGDESDPNVVGAGRAPTEPADEPKASPVVVATLRARRDGLIGGAILGVAVAGLGVVSIVTAPDYGIESLRSPFGYVLLGLAVVLGVSAVRGGQRGRYSAGVVSLAFGGLLIAGYGLPLGLFAVPFFVSAFLLFRSLSVMDFRNRRFVIAGVATAAIVGGFVAWSMAGSSYYSDPGRIHSLAESSPGQCFDEIFDDQGSIGIQTRSCDLPHMYEMLAIETYPSADDADYPGAVAISDHAHRFCLTAFIDYVGIPPASSALQYSYLDPSETSWSNGDRWIECFVGGPPPAPPLVGSVRGTKR